MMRSRRMLPGLKYAKYMHVDEDPNGGGLVLRSYHEELQKLSSEQMKEFVDEYFKAVFNEETEGCSRFCMGIVHGAANFHPDYLDYFAEHYPNMIIKQGTLGRSDIETSTMVQYRDNVAKTYSCGTFRAGPLHQVSLVGTKQEEVGDYFPEFLDILEKCPFLYQVMPWGPLAVIHGLDRNLSNDGPILWGRPGEQMIPAADMPKSPFKGRRR